MLKELTNSNWQLFFLMTCAAILPSGLTILPLAMIWFFLWLVTGEYKNFKPNFWFYTLECFFVLYTFGFFYSQNIAVAAGSLQWKLSFLFFPFLLNTVKLNRSRLNIVLIMFVVSNVMIGIFLMIRVFVKAVIFNGPIPTYSKFSFFTHPSYLSLFMVWSMVIIFFADVKMSDKPVRDRVLKFTSIIVLFISLLFCSSKIGLLSMVIVMAIYGISFSRRSRFYKQQLIGLGVFLTIFLLFISLVSTPLDRFLVGYNSLAGKPIPRHLDTMIRPAIYIVRDTSIAAQDTLKINTKHKCTDKESTLVRVGIWQCSGEIMRSNFLFGVGTGDVNDVLLKKYEKHDLKAAAAHRLNAHNQFIETQLGIGILGLIALIILTVGFLIYAFRTKNLMAGIFAGLMICNLVVESMFQWEVACTFFTFFMLLLIRKETITE